MKSCKSNHSHCSTCLLGKFSRSVSTGSNQHYTGAYPRYRPLERSNPDRVSPILVSFSANDSMLISTLLPLESRTQCNLRSEPSSRTSLTGEQPDPWKVLPLQDEMSRHRGAKQRRLCELLGAISLLSLA